jgi:hypothetical protein
MLDGFDRYFVDAVLQIRGVLDVPSPEQLREACTQLDAYYAAVMRAPEPPAADDEDWLDGHTFDSAATQAAYLYLHFGVVHVGQATAAETQAFSDWWLNGLLARARKAAAA